MPLTITLKAQGKKRAAENVPLQPILYSLLASGSEPPHPTKRAKRAETRQCPVCKEHIPLRLLAMHAELESERVEEVIKKVGSSEIPYEELIDESLPGPSSRRSAIKARKIITTRPRTNDTIEQSSKMIQTVKRHRKQRNLNLKEMIKEDEERGTSRDSWLGRFTGTKITCPVCLATVKGDQDVLDAHVDSCLAHENQRLEEARQRERLHRQAIEEEVWGNANEDSNYVGDVRGAGFYTREADECVDEEVDIDGDDQAVFGEVQFTEGDVVPVNLDQEEIDEDIEVEIESDDLEDAQRLQMTLRELVAVGGGNENAPSNEDLTGAQTDTCDHDKLEFAVFSARQRGDKSALISALETKLKVLESAPSSSTTSILCRICIDPYKEPTVSTGCWHTCCKDCWLRCLGSTKLCPICKRITGASDLRRVYL